MNLKIRKFLWRAPGIALLALVALLSLPQSAHAIFVAIATVDIGFQSGAESGNWQANIPVTGNPFSWTLAAPVTIYSTNTPGFLMGTIDGLVMNLNNDPAVSLLFGVTAGFGPTTFTISSPVVSFAPLTGTSGFATAAMTVTDNDGNGGSATGTFPGGRSYQAQYNGGGSTFANLVLPITAPPTSSGSGNERFPAVGLASIPGTVTDIQSQFSFVLTPFDSASGTSRFSITPEPSSFVLALFGAIGSLWCVRRRFGASRRKIA